MDRIEKEGKIIKHLVRIYSDQRGMLENTAKVIAGVFEKLLLEKGEYFNLISKNSVRDLKYFSVVFRIKEADSLHEKFYRSDMLHKNFHAYRNASTKLLDENQNKIRTLFEETDDVIGIKILTDLNEDCQKVLTLLRSNEQYLIENNIKLNKVDLDTQPSLMKNGLDIYKISATHNRNKFELQIKSKIVSAWGDMEHSIFYKNYFISPLRENTQATMNHIGKLLYQIDDFLVSVREANSTYSKNAEIITFLSWLDNTYSKEISKKLNGVSYKIDNISELLFFIKKHIKKEIKPSRELRFEHFTINASTSQCKQYVDIRNNSYDLQILEAIVFSWLFDGRTTITNKNIDKNISTFIALMIEFICEKILQAFQGYNRKEILKDLFFYFDSLLEHTSSPKVFLSHDSYLNHYHFLTFLRSEMELMNIFDQENFNILSLIYLNIRLGGDCKSLISDLQITATRKLKILDLLKEINNQIKLKEKVGIDGRFTDHVINFIKEGK